MSYYTDLHLTFLVRDSHLCKVSMVIALHLQIEHLGLISCCFRDKEVVQQRLVGTGQNASVEVRFRAMNFVTSHPPFPPFVAHALVRRQLAALFSMCPAAPHRATQPAPFLPRPRCRCRVAPARSSPGRSLPSLSCPRCSSVRCWR